MTEGRARALMLAAILATPMRAIPAEELIPPRLAAEIEPAVLQCHSIHSGKGFVTGTVEIEVSVGADGRATAVATPPGLSDTMAAAAQCVGVLLRYRPAQAGGEPVAGRLELAVVFPSLPTVRGELRKVIDYCHAPWSLEDLKEGTVNLVVLVGADGRVKEHRLPEGVLPWMEEAAACVAREVEYYPALLRTTRVDAWTVLPLEFQLSSNRHYDAEVAPPRIRSEEAAILAAYRKCYPAGETGTAQIDYRITIAKNGRVRRAELMESSGNRALDDAGLCILRNISFVAARRNGFPVESTLNWPILVRPAD